MKTMAGKGIPGFDQIAGSWAHRAPLGWDTTDPRPVAGAVAFRLSDLSTGITGELLHVAGGFHAMGTEPGMRAVPDGD
jgi:enoyl ACP reductase